MPAPKDKNTEKKKVSASKAATKKTMDEGKAARNFPAPMLKLMEDLRKDEKWRKFVEEQRQVLLDLRDNVLDSMAGVTKDTLRNHAEGSEASGSGEHQGDAGSEAYDRDFALSILSKEQNALYEIEEALTRVEEGSYGICEISYKKIPMLRLKAIPFARLTVECQAQWEKENKGKGRYAPNSSFGFRSGQQNDAEMSVSLDDDVE